MRVSILPLAVIVLTLVGCATLSEPDRNVLRQHHVSPQLYAKMDHGERLSLTDIIELAERHVPAPFVVHYLRSTYAVYRLTSEDVVILRQAGVSRQVIDYLLTTPTLFAPQYDAWGWGYGDPYWWGYSSDFVGYGHYDGHEHGHHHH